MSRVYLDTNVFVYAVGGHSPLREPARAVLDAVVRGRLRGETSTHAIQEFARQRLRREDPQATVHARQAVAICSVVHPIDRDTLLATLSVVDRNPALDAADAVHVAVAERQGLAVLVSADSDFDGVAGIERVDPRDGDRLEALANG
ncbi:MAG: type II toxin-antitoxin system VapC family toxin [Solirubrobacterales bacterium]|nr:type II toxin-antitoxin system VapC family toxin [Solirubrobacterales bacterium]